MKAIFTDVMREGEGSPSGSPVYISPNSPYESGACRMLDVLAPIEQQSQRRTAFRLICVRSVIKKRKTLQGAEGFL